MSIRSKKLAGAAALAAAMALGTASAQATLVLDYNVTAVGGGASGSGKAVTGPVGSTATVTVTATITGGNAAADEGIQSVRANFVPDAAGLTLSAITSTAFNGSGSVLTTPSTAVFRAPESALGYVAAAPTVTLGTFVVTLGGSGTINLSDTFNIDSSVANGGPVYVVDAVGVLPEANPAAQSVGAAIAFTIGGAATYGPGDVNHDHIVDQLDLNLVNGHWQQTGVGLALGDANEDGIVDQLDLNEVNGHWQQTTSPRGLSVVPEPTALGLLGLGAMALFNRRRRA